ncbi:MAG TPA: hypothetical protein VJ957_00780 [Longimicrobiales bacterium]|nr:hypothetical protein [Longimicrobiales bacterium]
MFAHHADTGGRRLPSHSNARRFARLLGGAFLCAASLALTPHLGAAQYFGQNEVQYKHFDFEVLASQHFNVYYYPVEADAAAVAGRIAERWYYRYEKLFDHKLVDRQPFILYADHPDFSQTTAISGGIGQGTGGVTEPLKRRVVLPMAGDLKGTNHVIGHELVHAFQYDISGINPGSPRFGEPSISGMPLWLIEGMPEYITMGERSPLTAMWMRDALQQKRGLPDLKQLANSNEYFPYRYGQSFLAYLGGRFGDQAVTQIFKTAVANRTGPQAAIRKVLGVSPDTLVKEWHAALKAYYWPLKAKTDSAGAYGKALFGNENGYDHYNVSPALSPDGKRLLFLSQRDPFSMDLYLADVQTGKVIRRITTSALDPHYSSLQFIQSAGSWAPDGRRFAFSAISAGEPVITIMDADTGDKVKELRLPQFGAIFNPTWSPDGEQIAFVANDGGFLNLWVVNAASGDLRRLTNDEYAELHPDWSPDGKWIAISTDRFSTQLSDLDPGRFDLALISPSTGEIHRVATFEGSNNINPHWAPDGKTLYFVSDVGGVPNLYRLDPGAAKPVPLTNLYVGVSGITELSPALAVAAKSGTIVFNAYEKGNFVLYRLDHADLVKDGGAPARADQYDAARLPPLQRADTALLHFLGDPTDGLPQASSFKHHDYDPDLSLDYISQPSLGLGVSSFGSFVGGGAGLHFSDMLGRQELATQLQLQILNGHVLDGIGAIAQYVNHAHRTNWGVIGGQMPQVYQSAYGGYADVNGDGQTDLVQQTLYFWEVNRELMGLLQYPFNRALRFQLSGGYAYTGFNVELQNQAFSLTTGQRILNQTSSVPACGDSLNFYSTICQPGGLSEATGSAALVFDNSLMGPTGPVAGERFHLEVSPSFGTLNYLTAIADFRAYKRLTWNITLAGRLMQIGNYGPDSNDFRLSRIFLGYPSLIRGYDYGSFNPNNCPSGQPINQCSEITVLQDLFGTRMAVGNVELRLPLFGPLGLITRNGNAPPADLVGFYDAGVAWTSDSQATFLGGPRPILTSAGIGLRVNLFGFLLGELDWVDPFQRSAKRMYLTFGFNTGF